MLCSCNQRACLDLQLIPVPAENLLLLLLLLVQICRLARLPWATPVHQQTAAPAASLALPVEAWALQGAAA
jgi:hypothetical protein